MRGTRYNDLTSGDTSSMPIETLQAGFARLLGVLADPQASKNGGKLSPHGCGHLMMMGTTVEKKSVLQYCLLSGNCPPQAPPLYLHSFRRIPLPLLVALAKATDTPDVSSSCSSCCTPPSSTSSNKKSSRSRSRASSRFCPSSSFFCPFQSPCSPSSPP